MRKYTIVLEGNWLRTKIVDGFDNEDLENWYLDFQHYMSLAPPVPNSIHILANVSEVSKITASLRKALNITNEVNNKYMQLGHSAVWGSSRMMKVLVQMINSVRQQEKQVGFFNSQAEAETWLRKMTRTST